MWQIAFGIILAIVLIRFAPLIISGGLLVIAGGAAVLIGFLLLGTEGGRDVLVVGISSLVVIFVFRWTVAFSKRQGKHLHEESTNAGGFDRWLGDRGLELRPALTEAQKIRKEADRIIRRAQNREIRDSRELARKTREKDRLDRQAVANLTAAQHTLERRARRLATKFKGYPFFEFSIADGMVLINDIEGSTKQRVACIRCELLDLYPHFTVSAGDAEKGETFSDPANAIKAARTILRGAAASALARAK